MVPGFYGYIQTRKEWEGKKGPCRIGCLKFQCVPSTLHLSGAEAINFFV